MMQTRSDTLLLPVEKLEHALAEEVAGRECDWAENLRSALATVDVALRHHAAEVEGHDGLLAQVDLTRPTLVRQVSGLRQEHADLLEQTEAVQVEVQRAAQAFQSRANPMPLANSLPEPVGRQAVPDFGAIRQEAERLMAALRHHREQETALLFESLETDIGVCD